MLKILIIPILLFSAVSMAWQKRSYSLHLTNGLGAPITGKRIFLLEERKYNGNLHPGDNFYVHAHRGKKTNDEGFATVSFNLNENSIQDRFLCANFSGSFYCANIAKDPQFAQVLCVTNIPTSALSGYNSIMSCSPEQDTQSCKFVALAKTTVDENETFSFAAICNAKN